MKGEGSQYSDPRVFVWHVTQATRVWFPTHYSEAFTNVSGADAIKHPFAGCDGDTYKLRPTSSADPRHSTGSEKSDFLITTQKIRVYAQTGKDLPVSLHIP